MIKNCWESNLRKNLKRCFSNGHPNESRQSTKFWPSLQFSKAFSPCVQQGQVFKTAERARHADQGSKHRVLHLLALAQYVWSWKRPLWQMQKSELHVPPFPGTWTSAKSVAAVVCTNALTISSVSLWPFAEICPDFSIPFDDAPSVIHFLCVIGWVLLILIVAFEFYCFWLWSLCFLSHYVELVILSLYPITTENINILSCICTIETI
jgi:hypothetical protein